MLAVAASEGTPHTRQEALHALCTERAVIYTVLGIASAVCGAVKRHLVNQPNLRDLVLDFVQSILSSNRQAVSGRVLSLNGGGRGCPRGPVVPMPV
jgi:hypothetical protein